MTDTLAEHYLGSAAGEFRSLKRAGEDLLRTVVIRGEPHTIVAAVNRQLAHYGQHAGQIVFLAKHLRSSEWKTLSIPRGSSEAFNRKVKGERG